MSDSNARFREIIHVFARYGFGEFYHRNFSNRSPEESAVKLRQAFEELGPSFIKIGQTLATRNDLLPDVYIKELSKLQTSSPPFSYEEADDIFFQEFGEKMDEAFIDVEQTPFATGSIAQVHRAKNHKGNEIIIKVQRPKIKENLIRDIDLFIDLIQLIPQQFTDIIMDPIPALEDIREQTLLELDFNHEAHNQIRFKNNHKKRKVIEAPDVDIKYTSEKVIVQEFIDGIDLTNPQKLKDAGYDLTDISKKIISATLYQLFKDGFYHADPHQGNIIISDAKIYYIDFGLMGEFTPNYQRIINELMYAVVMKDINKLTELILVICKPRGYVNEADLYYDVASLFNRYLTSGYWAIDLNSMFQDFMRLALKHDLVFPTEFVTLIKTAIVVQGISSELDPDCDFMQVFTQFVTSNPTLFIDYSSAGQKILRQASRNIESLNKLPSQLNELMTNLNQDRIGVNLGIKNADHRVRQLNQMVNRLIVGILLAAIIISSGLVVASDRSHVSNIGLVFFICAVFMAIYLLYSFIRSRKK